MCQRLKMNGERKRDEGQGREEGKITQGVWGSSTFYNRMPQPYFPASHTVKIPMCKSKQLQRPLHLYPPLSLPLCPITHQSFSIKQINWLDILISVVFDLVEYITDVYIAEAIMLLVFLKDRSALFFKGARHANRLRQIAHTDSSSSREPPLLPSGIQQGKG